MVSSAATIERSNCSQKSARNGGADHLDTPPLEAGPERFEHLLRGCLLRLFLARLLLDANEHVAFRVQALDLQIAEIEHGERAAHLADVRGARCGSHFDQRAALEVDAVVEAVDQNDAERDYGKQRREHEAMQLVAHERQSRAVRKEVETLEIGHQKHGV